MHYLWWFLDFSICRFTILITKMILVIKYLGLKRGIALIMRTVVKSAKGRWVVVAFGTALLELLGSDV